MVATVARPETAVAAIAMGTFDATVIRPLVSTVNVETLLAVPYDPAATPETANRVASNVPDVMLVAFVVSVVAEGARPVIEVTGRTMGTLEAKVRRPFESTVNVGVTLEAP